MGDGAVLLRDEVRSLSPRITRHAAFYSSFGPADGPVIYSEQLPTIGVFARVRRGFANLYPIGKAHPVAWVRYGGVYAATFRIVIGTEELAARWVCDGRRFVRLEEGCNR